MSSLTRLTEEQPVETVRQRESEEHGDEHEHYPQHEGQGPPYVSELAAQAPQPDLGLVQEARDKQELARQQREAYKGSAEAEARAGPRKRLATTSRTPPTT